MFVPIWGAIKRDLMHLSLFWRRLAIFAGEIRTQVMVEIERNPLVVRLGGHARVITLSSALRRCRVVGARLVDDVPGRQALTVDFEPDPALWRG